MNSYVKELKDRLKKKRVTKVRCLHCNSIITTSDNQTKSCRCGDVTVFQYTGGRYDVAFRCHNNSYENVYEVLHEEREALNESYQTRWKD